MLIHLALSAYCYSGFIIPSGMMYIKILRERFTFSEVNCIGEAFFRLGIEKDLKIGYYKYLWKRKKMTPDSPLCPLFLTGTSEQKSSAACPIYLRPDPEKLYRNNRKRQEDHYASP